MLFGTHEAIKIYKIYLPFIKLLHFRIAYEIRVIHFHLYLFLGAVWLMVAKGMQYLLTTWNHKNISDFSFHILFSCKYDAIIVGEHGTNSLTLHMDNSSPQSLVIFETQSPHTSPFLIHPYKHTLAPLIDTYLPTAIARSSEHSSPNSCDESSESCVINENDSFAIILPFTNRKDSYVACVSTIWKQNLIRICPFLGNSYL